ncbi:hypothetical protein Ddye_028069 [Dipteronia dyeriana]|uniref:Uncharacterized protein n=1 Tax=Dipteronia dyeriana TaxID=168575 RepID=A0AAD9WQT7_9ROSI|nr:hypothetical protein Ddye_028069 [Dipteronia dyeriana]
MPYNNSTIDSLIARIKLEKVSEDRNHQVSELSHEEYSVLDRGVELFLEGFNGGGDTWESKPDSAMDPLQNMIHKHAFQLFSTSTSMLEFDGYRIGMDVQVAILR